MQKVGVGGRRGKGKHGEIAVKARVLPVFKYVCKILLLRVWMRESGEGDGDV